MLECFACRKPLVTREAAGAAGSDEKCFPPCTAGEQWGPVVSSSLSVYGSGSGEEDGATGIGDGDTDTTLRRRYACTPCPYGTYANPGHWVEAKPHGEMWFNTPRDCVDCPKGLTTPRKGATSELECALPASSKMAMRLSSTQITEDEDSSEGGEAPSSKFAHLDPDTFRDPIVLKALQDSISDWVQATEVQVSIAMEAEDLTGKTVDFDGGGGGGAVGLLQTGGAKVTASKKAKLKKELVMKKKKMRLAMLLKKRRNLSSVLSNSNSHSPAMKLDAEIRLLQSELMSAEQREVLLAVEAKGTPPEPVTAPLSELTEVFRNNEQLAELHLTAEGTVTYCEPGYGLFPANLTSPVCQICPAGYYGTGGDNGGCVACPPGSSSAAASKNATDCYVACDPGYGISKTSFDGECELCGEGFFSPGGISECIACPSETTSKIGSLHVIDCMVECGPGKFWNKGKQCSPCPVNSYSPGGTLATKCINCPMGIGKVVVVQL